MRDDSLWNGRYLGDRLADKLCNGTRVREIVDALGKYLPSENECRALCFCVNKKHADFMARELGACGLRAQSLTSDTIQENRTEYAAALREGRLNYLCVVDVFNEGVDLPEIDTVLFLRPTDSLTVFLQQLGRGLRLYPGKDALTVLDFIAQVNRRYDYAGKFRALVTNREGNIKSQIESGFTSLPPGCDIVMESVARRYILDNIKGAVYNRHRIVADLRNFDGNPGIEEFLEYIGQDDVRLLYPKNFCWTSIKRAAGKIEYEDDEVTKRLEKGMANLVHHNTVSFLRFVSAFASGSRDYKKAEFKTYATMLYYILYSVRLDKTEFRTMYDALEKVREKKYACFMEEMRDLASFLTSRVEITTVPLGKDGFPGMELYGCYTREEIFTLSGVQTEKRRMQGTASGVFMVKEENTALLFVTLDKSDKDFSPSTQYDDYVIDEGHFHWQSRNTDSHENKGGRIYTEQEQTHVRILLFVRERKKDSFGTCPFHCFGPVKYLDSEGDFPMNIKWKVENPVMARYVRAV